MRHDISIWFFAGLMLLIYGIIIVSAGVWELSHPLPHPPVLSNLHAPLWWGGMLAIAGLAYTIKYRPTRKS